MPAYGDKSQQRSRKIEEKTAGRTLALIFAFPASFFFASFYTESLFLFLAVLGFTLALQEKWGWTGLVAKLIEQSGE